METDEWSFCIESAFKLMLSPRPSGLQQSLIVIIPNCYRHFWTTDANFSSYKRILLAQHPPASRKCSHRGQLHNMIWDWYQMKETFAVSICTRILKCRVWKIEFDELDFLSISNSNFAGYTGSKNLVQTRQKFQFIKLNFSNLIFQNPSADRYRVWEDI